MMKRQMKRHAWLVYIAATGLTATWGPAAGEDAGNATDPDEPLVAGELVQRPITDPEALFGGARFLSVAGERLEVDALGGDLTVQEGMQLMLQVYADDNRQPQAKRGFYLTRYRQKGAQAEKIA